MDFKMFSHIVKNYINVLRSQSAEILMSMLVSRLDLDEKRYKNMEKSSSCFVDYFKYILLYYIIYLLFLS